MCRGRKAHRGATLLALKTEGGAIVRTHMHAHTHRHISFHGTSLYFAGTVIFAN